jgi:hypothetical protein
VTDIEGQALSRGFTLDFSELLLNLVMREVQTATHMRLAFEYVHAPH